MCSEEFERRRLAGDFLECCRVFGSDTWYGTLKSQVTPSLEAGKSVLLEIDVDGTRQVLSQFPNAETIFVEPRSATELETRLRGRGTESEEALLRRLAVAQSELEQATLYRHRVVNDTVDQAIEQIIAILTKAEVAEE